MKIDSLNVRKVIEVSAMTVSGLALSMLLIPLLLPFFFFFYVVSCVVVGLARLRRGKITKAHGMDVLAGKETSESYPVINVALRFRGKMDVQRLRERISYVILNSRDVTGERKFKRLMQQFSRIFGYFFWEDAPFVIENHVKSIDLEEMEKRAEKDFKRIGVAVPIDNETFPAKLLEGDAKHDAGWVSMMKNILNEFGNRRFPSGTPKWELLLFEESDQRYTGLFRFHHSIADGVYITRLLCEEFLDSPTKLFHSYVPPTFSKKMVLYVWSLCLFPFGLWKIFRNRDVNVIHGPKLSGTKKYFMSKKIEMDALRDIRKKTEVSIHGVLFSCLSAGLAAHYNIKKQPNDSTTVLIPMPLQNLQKPVQLKNRYAVISLKIPTVTADPAGTVLVKSHEPSTTKSTPILTPLKRLEALKVVLNKTKQDPTFISVQILINAICSVFPARMAEAMLSTKGCSLNFSNMPGPQELLRFEGNLIDDVMFWIPDRDPLGFAVSILSYNGLIRMGLAVDTALLSNAQGESFVKSFENQIDLIFQSIFEEEITTNNTKSEKEILLKSIP